MKLKDIVNRESVNLTNCESEPIHIPGTIQPHGFLLGIQEPSLKIRYCSANCVSFLEKNLQDIIGSSLTAFFLRKETEQFEMYIATLQADSKPFVFTIQNIPYNTTVHRSGDFIILEFEPFPDGSINVPDLYLQIKKFVAMIEDAGSLQQLSQAVADETRIITGYDRVMVYRFDKDYNGEVFAESKKEELESFLGLNYPHTDIPAQARELYMRNLLRNIVDVDYQPVPIFTDEQNFAANKNLDLSLSILRSVSPIHIEYLKNMGVQGTMSISLIHNKKLWGLIACHHYSARNIPHYTRLSAKLQGHFLTSQIDVRETVERHEKTIDVTKKLETLLNKFNTTEFDLIEKLSTDECLYKFINANGVVVLEDGNIFAAGLVPDAAFIKSLAVWAFEHSINGEFTTNELAGYFPAGSKIPESATGVIYRSLGPSWKNCIIWCRKEVVTTVNWAGNPDKAIVRYDDKTALSPRKSFELWKQIVQHKSREWDEAEMQGANKFTAALQKQFHLLDLQREEEKLRKLAEKLRSANEELKNINWISAHDLKEPLRKIRLFASKIMDNASYDLPEKVIADIKKINSISERMQQLLSDILEYSIVASKESSFEKTDLNMLIKTVLAELEEEIEEKNAKIKTDQLPVINVVPFQFHQLMINLIQNALKFSSANRDCIIKITYSLSNGTDMGDSNIRNNYHKFRLEDNGIGFDNAYSERIMNLFQKLHVPAEYSGTGIGLAICKKIMDNHNGFIFAKGEPDKGAVIDLWFPADL